MAKKYKLRQKTVTLKCETCGERFEREQSRINEAKAYNHRYSFCSRECADAGRKGKKSKRIKDVEVNCAGCKKTFMRRKSEIRKNKTGLLFCSQDCSSKNIKMVRKLRIDKDKENNNKKLNKWLEGGIGPKQLGSNTNCIYRQYLLKESQRKCTDCGWGKANPINNIVYVHIDHIDGNRGNNKKNNLRFYIKCNKNC